jgi:hypothetical protein
MSRHWEIGTVYKRENRYFLALSDDLHPGSPQLVQVRKRAEGDFTLRDRYAPTSMLGLSSGEVEVTLLPTEEENLNAYQRVRGFQVAWLIKSWGITIEEFDSLVVKHLRTDRFQEAARARLKGHKVTRAEAVREQLIRLYRFQAR